MKYTFTRSQLFAGGVTLAVVAAVIAGLFLAGSPEKERIRLADEQRINDLQQISYAMDVFWNAEGILPASLPELAKHQNVFVQRIQDPQTGEPYPYRATSERTYELCAVFTTSSFIDPNQPPQPPLERFWQHEAGQTCYSLEIHPDTVTTPKPLPLR